MEAKTKRLIKNIFNVAAGIFFIYFGILKLYAPTRDLDSLFGALMLIYGVGSIALFPRWKRDAN